MIEYVSRVVSLLRLIDDDFNDESELSQDVHSSILKFVSHHVWQKSNGSGGSTRKLWSQMEGRMNEMLDRRRRLIKYTLKKERESLIGDSNLNTL